MKLHGKATLVDDQFGRAWAISAAPHIMVRLKRVFARINPNQHGVVSLSDSPENATELKWFCQRFPLEIHPLDYLERRAEEHARREQLVHEVLALNYTPPDFKMALPPRDYQRLVGDLVLRSGALLCADEVGLGKTVEALTMISDPRSLPALVVTMPHLQRQWQREILRFLPGLSVHILKRGHPYDLTRGPRGKKTSFPDVILSSYHKLNGWAQTLGEKCNSATLDEMQELRIPTSGKYLAALHICGRMKFNLGLSVGPQSRVELRGGPFGTGWCGPIEDAWDMMSGQSYFCRGYEIIDAGLHLIEARGWEQRRTRERGFRWKKVQSFVRHACDRDVREISFGGKQRLIVTDDHSVYVAGKNRLRCPRADELNIGDVVPVDNGSRWNENEREDLLDVALVARVIPRAQINVDLGRVSRHELGLKAWEWQNCHSEATYGPRLPVAVYLRHREMFPVSGPVYIGRGKACAVPSLVRLSDWAYVLGFFIGDGWVSDKQRVCFAVESARIENFVSRLLSLPLGLRPSIRKMRGKSVEVRCSHRLFAEILANIFGGARCYRKRIPASWITTWPEEARRELLRGLVDSDGHQSLRNGRANARYITTSPELAQDVLVLLRSLGVHAGLYRRNPSEGGTIDGRKILGRRDGFTVHWSSYSLDGPTRDHRGHRCSIEWGFGVFNESRVTGWRRVERPRFVYDIGMTGHPSFVANGLLVHNTATPVYNYGNEIHAVLSVLKPDALGTKYEFEREWCTGGSQEQDEPTQAKRGVRVRDPRALGLHLREQGLMLRRTRPEVGREIPKVESIPFPIEADLAALNKVEARAAELARIILAQGSQARGEKLHAAEEFSNTLRQATGIAKAPYVADFVRMLVEGGEKVCLFGWHRAVYEIWLSKLSDLGPVLYTGSESPARKEDNKKLFVEGHSKVIIISNRSGAGLDGLQFVCRIAVIGELDWSPAVQEQNIGRIARDGQPHPVAAYIPLAQHGADPTMADVLGIKRAQSEAIRDPDAPLIEQLQVDEGRIRRLAEAFLAQHGHRTEQQDEAVA